MSEPSAKNAHFHALGRRVSGRLHLIHAIRWLNRTILPVALLLLLFVAANRLLGLGLLEWPVVAGVLVLWLIVVLAVNLFQPRRPYHALARWERIMDTRSTLASAEFFESQKERTPGQEWHLERAAKLMEERRPRMKKDLPLPRPGWGWLALPVLAALLMMPAVLQPVLSTEDLVMSEEMQERARGEAESLERQRERLADLEAISQEDKEQMEKLAEMLESTSEMLTEGASDMSAREMLESLEARAREAEKMADALGKEGEEWASAELVEALSQQPDTSEMGTAIQDKEAERTAAEARELAQKLETPELKREVRERMTAALDKAEKAATEDDLQKPVGQHVRDASTEMNNEQADRAAAEFKRLAEHFENVARREQAQEELKELAEQLRESGNNIAQSQLEQMQEMQGQSQGQEAPEGAQSLAEASPELQSQPPGPQGQQGQPQPNQGMTAPGPQNMQNQQGKEGQGLQAPVPGMANQQQQQGEGAPQPGQGQGQQGETPVPGMMAPVPGQQPEGEQQPGAMAGTAQAQSSTTVPGNGLQAGNATAPMGENATSSFDVSKDGMVQAGVNEAGDSTVRQVQGGVRDEDSQRASREQATSFLAVEEEALDEKALPVSRREQVQKYFTELRRQFEAEE